MIIRDKKKRQVNMKVLFVCGDNMGRSQAAEALFNLHAKTSKAESCAGKLEIKENTTLSDIKNNKKVEDVVKILKKDYNIDISKKMAKPFSMDMTNNADIIISMCSEGECLNIPKAEHWDVPYLPPLDFKGKEEAIKALDEKIKDLLKRIGD